MSAFQALLDYVRNCEQYKRYDMLPQSFVIPVEPRFRELALDINQRSEEEIAQELANLKVANGTEYAEILKRYLRFMKGYVNQDWNLMARVMIDLLRNLSSIIKPKYSEDRQILGIEWFIPCLRKLVLAALAACTQADTLNPRARTRGDAFAELRTLLGLANLRNGPDKPTVTIFLAGQIVRVSLQLHVQGALAQMLRQISTVVARLDSAPQADRLRFCYWAGRWHLLEHRIGVAYPLLKTALEICPNFMRMHKRSILRQLCGAAIPLGIFPHPTLLQAFGFGEYFIPVIKALKCGDAIALGLAIDSPVPREWFRKCGLHTVLQEKCWVMLWRNLVYKTYVFLESRAAGEKVDGIPFSLLTAAFRFSYDVDDGWETAHIQSVVMSLVAQGYIVGRVEDAYLSLRPNGSRKERFPQFSNVRQTYQVQTVWGINLRK